VPTRYVWNAWVYRFLAPSVLRFDSRPGASWTNFWWTGDSGQVGAFWYAYSSAWLPAALLKSQNQSRLVDAWFAASRHWGVSFHFNKGLAGAPAAAINEARNTAMNPDVPDAFALANYGLRRPAGVPRLTSVEPRRLVAQRGRGGCRRGPFARSGRDGRAPRRRARYRHLSQRM
jgi:hypothetical protein